MQRGRSSEPFGTGQGKAYHNRQGGKTCDVKLTERKRVSAKNPLQKAKDRTQSPGIGGPDREGVPEQRKMG